MKKVALLITLSAITLTGFGCAADQLLQEDVALDPVEVIEREVEVIEIEPEPEVIVEDMGTVYVSFIQNVHDWVNPEMSLETINRLIDIHEQYQIPVDLYYDDQVMQAHLEHEPGIFNRIATSPYVATSWHIRPPHPIDPEFDNYGLEDMTHNERVEVFRDIESHKLDIVTGLTTNEPGGFAYMKELIGYAPRVVAWASGGGEQEALAQVYKEMGALFTLTHGRAQSISEVRNGLYFRPEDQEVKLYESNYDDPGAMDEYMDKWLEGHDGEGDWFINLKYHENNFYTSGTPFGPMFWEDYGRGRQLPYAAPYDISLTVELAKYKTEEEQANKWEVYEAAVKYIGEHQEEYIAITSIDLEEMIK